MKNIKLYINIMLLVFVSQTATAQFSYETRKDNYIKGSVYLYKKTILKDFTEKFGAYEASTKNNAEWYMYDETGRKIFEQKDRTKSGRKTAYERTIYYFDEDRLLLSVSAFTIGNKDDDYSFTYYKYPQSSVMEEYVTSIYDNKMTIGVTKRYNSKYLLLEESKYLGEKSGYKKVYKYDNNDEKISYTEYNGIGNIEGKTIYKRDNKGNLLEETAYNTEGKVKRKKIFEYNPAGKLTKLIEYNSDGMEISKSEINYINDTLQVYSVYVMNGQVFYEFKSEYDDKNHLKKQVFTVDYYGNKTNEYIEYDYDRKGNLISQNVLKNQKMTKKIMFLNYVGNQYLSYTAETYNADGSIKELIAEKYDKYGNTIAYEKYKYETKFGEKLKIPIEKHEIEIAYYDGTPKLKVQMEIVKEKFIPKGKKENVLTIKIKNAKVKPKIHLYDKSGITHYGGSKANEHKSGYNFSYQYSYLKQFFKPYFIVEAGAEVVLVKLPSE
ncbi:MAG: hypothetical protein DRI95_15200 [Bacteroidetes bacterium]|nr:MAG: hypothetical protein DRI95_15200 [Bacteroidota bacterium]